MTAAAPRPTQAAPSEADRFNARFAPGDTLRLAAAGRLTAPGPGRGAAVYLALPAWTEHGRAVCAVADSPAGVGPDAPALLRRIVALDALVLR